MVHIPKTFLFAVAYTNVKRKFQQRKIHSTKLVNLVSIGLLIAWPSCLKACNGWYNVANDKKCIA